MPAGAMLQAPQTQRALFSWISLLDWTGLTVRGGRTIEQYVKAKRKMQIHVRYPCDNIG